MKSNRNFRRSASLVVGGLLFVGVVGCSDPAAANATKVQQVLKSFAGVWTVVSLDRDGKPAAVRDATVSVLEDKFVLIENVGAKKQAVAGVTLQDARSEEYTLQADPANPANINLAITNGPNLGKVKKGIFAVEEKRLKLCVAEPDRERPAAFASGEKTTCMVLEPISSDAAKK